MIDNESDPGLCGIAFKEWAGVCEAIGAGRQSLIVRKGGIAEGPSGFVPEHSAFWLYPTHVHEAQQGLKGELASTVAPTIPSDRVEMKTLVRVEHVRFVSDLDALARLAEHHVWTEETVRKRFEYRKPGLWVLLVRAFRQVPGHLVRITPEQAGCKTWVTLETRLPTAGLAPVLEHDRHTKRLARIMMALGQEP
jgi:hypothetical protein